MTELVNSVASREWATGQDGTVRLALIGLGWWTTEEVLPALEDSSFCEATVAVSGSKENANSLVEDWETLERGLTYDEFQNGIGVDAYDAVYICTPNAFHCQYAESAAELGKDVLCEKPMESTVERAERMVTACEDAGVDLMIGYRLQTDPVVRHARELVQDGAIGQPTHVLGNNSQSLLEINADPDQWRLDPEISGDGTSVMDLGIYPLNTARFILDANPVGVQSMMHSTDEAFADVPDERAVFSLSLDDGSYVTATASQNSHGTTHLRVIGTDGELLLEPAFHMQTDLRIDRPKGRVTVSPAEINQMTELFDYFADRVLGDAPIEPDGHHGVVDMKTMRAIYQAARDGETVLIDE